MKSLLFFCLSTFLFYSCSKKENSLYPIIDLADAIENPVEKSVYDIAESVEVVQLETNDSLLIPYVSQLIMTDQYFIIGYGKKCSLFSHSGKFVCDIAQKGSGPEEYTMLMNLLYINNRVLITDLNNKVNVYSLNGKFIESYQALPDMFSAIYPMSDKNFIGFKAQSGGDEKERLVFYRRDEKRGAIPYQQNYQAKKVCFFPHEAQFSSLHDKLYFKQLLNDTIFSVDTVKHSLSPEYIIDWGKLRSNDRLRYSLENPDEELFLHMPYVPLFSMTADGLVLGAIAADMDQKKQYYLTAFYDKANHQADLFELKLSKKEMDYFGEPTGKLPPYLEGDTFFPEYISQDGNYLISVRTQPLKEELNPALIVVKLK